MLSDRTVCKFMLCKGNKVFLIKTLNCRECAPLSLVYCSVHEKCAEGLFLHYSVDFCSERKRKAPYMWHFQCTFRTCLQYRATKVSIFVSQLLRIMRMKRRFRDTSATCPEFAPIRFVRYRKDMLHSSAMWTYSTKAKNMVKSTVSLWFASLCTKDLETRWAGPL